VLLISILIHLTLHILTNFNAVNINDLKEIKIEGIINEITRLALPQEAPTYKDFPFNWFWVSLKVASLHEVSLNGWYLSLLLETDKAIISLESFIDHCFFNIKYLSHLLFLWFSIFNDYLSHQRQNFENTLQHFVWGSEGLLMSSMVFGGSSDLPKDIKQSFKIIGMQHVMAASGFNVGLISQLVLQLTSKFTGRKLAALLALVTIWLYVALAGFTASVVRAGLMLSLVVIASRLLLRQTKILWMLGLTCLIMIGLNRSFLKDIGWQLSVTATAGLILMTPLLEKDSWISRIELGAEIKGKMTQASWLTRVINLFKDAALTTIAAQSLSLPLILHHFGELSLLSLPANTFLIWLTPLITLGGVWLLIISSLWSISGQIGEIPLRLFGLFLQFLTGFFLAAVTWLGSWEKSLLLVPKISWHVVLAWWSAVFLIVWGHSRRVKT